MGESFQKVLFLGVMVAVTAMGSNGSSGAEALLTHTTKTQGDLPSPPPVQPPYSSLQFGAPTIVTEGEENVGPVASLHSEEAYLPSAFYRVRQDPPPELGVEAALLADVRSGEAYVTLDPEKRWPLASVTKLMTATLALRSLLKEQSVTLTHNDFSPSDNSISRKLGDGESYTISDLLSATLVASSNEAAEALANAYGREGFIKELNAIARAWGMEETHFADPAGLSIANQSTAHDLQKMVQRMYVEYPEVFEISRKPRANITELGSKKRITLPSNNLFAGRADFVGGKTGYTDDARGNLISLFTHERRPILVVVLGTDDRFGETEKLMEWFRNSFRLSR